MLALCRSGEIDLIITKSISRFARNTVTLLETVRELKSLGIDVFFEEQNIHSISPDVELMLTILASISRRKVYQRQRIVNGRSGRILKKERSAALPFLAIDVMQTAFWRFNQMRRKLCV
jgi:DNA invertase Pin-like site-specific DNA recombinase